MYELKISHDQITRCCMKFCSPCVRRTFCSHRGESDNFHCTSDGFIHKATHNSVKVVTFSVNRQLLLQKQPQQNSKMKKIKNNNI